MTKRDFQTLEYIAEAIEQQTSQVGNGPDRLAMNPDVQSAADHAEKFLNWLEARREHWLDVVSDGCDDNYREQGLADEIGEVLAEFKSIFGKALQVEHEAKRDAAD